MPSNFDDFQLANFKSHCNTDHYHFFNHAASQVSAKDCVEEARAARKRGPCRTLAMIAAAKLDGADDPLFKILRGCGLVLDVPTTKLQLDPSFEYPCFSPRDMLLAIAKRGFLRKVLGVPLAKAHQAIPEFWRKHRKLFPNHELYSQPDVDYEHLIPYYLHGDGGRTFKKDGILICSMFPALGKGTRTKPIDLQPVPGEPPRGVKRKRADSHGSDGQFSAGINLLGNSLTTRFLFTALKYEFYKEHHHRFSELVNQWALFMKSLFEEGFDFNGETWRIQVLGLTGDAPFLREAGCHTRSFSNVRKSATSTAILKGVCWLCDAGRTNGPPYEDVNVLTAEWVRTCGPRNPLPWDTPSKLLEHLLVNDDDLAGFYLPDTFHIYYLGFGKEFAASSLIYIMKTVFKKRKLESSLEPLNDCLQRYRQLHKKERANFGRKISLELLGYKSGRVYPSGHWSKGADTAFVTKFIDWLMVEIFRGDHGDEWGSDAILHGIQAYGKAVGAFLRILYASGYFLESNDAREAIFNGLACSRQFVALATLCVGQKLCLFKVTPKLHMFCHVLLAMLQQYRIDPTAVINPLAQATFQCEDFVGRVARLSRRVSPKIHGTKVILRYLAAIEKSLKDEEA